MGYSWQIALLAVFVEGLIFLVLSLTNVREAIFNAIPMALKKGVSAGIGLFIAFIGLQGANLVVNDDSTLLTYVKFPYHRYWCPACFNWFVHHRCSASQKYQRFHFDWYSCHMDSWYDLRSNWSLCTGW